MFLPGGRAKSPKAQILLVQETMVSEVSSPGFSYQASRAGGHVLHAALSVRAGGVAVSTCGFLSAHWGLFFAR